MSLTFFSLNLEADRHLIEVTEYLKKYHPDVVHFQEIYRVHAEEWGRQFGYHVCFAAHADYQVTEHIFKPLGLWGVATLTKIKPIATVIPYYSAPPHTLPTDYCTLKEGHPRAIIIIKLQSDNKEYTFANTHFTWAMPDKADVEQAADFARLKVILEPYPSLVMSGDFNAPRESMVYRELATKYRSWVPEDVDTTLDPTYFRKPGLKLVVDHLFSTSDYKVADVEVITGLSDHCGIRASISK